MQIGQVGLELTQPSLTKPYTGAHNPNLNGTPCEFKTPNEGPAQISFLLGSDRVSSSLAQPLRPYAEL